MSDYLDLKSQFPRSFIISSDSIINLLVGREHGAGAIVAAVSYMLEEVVERARDNEKGEYAQFYLDYHLLRPIFDSMDEDRLKEVEMYVQGRLKEIRDE